MTLVDTVQRIVDGKWRHAAEARRAVARGDWRAFLRTASPPPSPLRLLAAAEYRRCVDRASLLVSGPHETTTEVIPVWVGNNEDEEPRSDWFVGHVVRAGAGSLALAEPAPVYEDASETVERVVRCEVTRWTVGHVVRTQAYAPSIALEIRGATFGVLKGDLHTVESAMESAGEALPRPTAAVPPWCHWIEPRVGGLGAALLAELDELSITVDEEGNQVKRPAPGSGSGGLRSPK